MVENGEPPEPKVEEVDDGGHEDLLSDEQVSIHVYCFSKNLQWIRLTDLQRGHDLHESAVKKDLTLDLLTIISVRPEGSEKTTPNMYKFLTLNVNNYKDKH